MKPLSPLVPVFLLGLSAAPVQGQGASAETPTVDTVLRTGAEGDFVSSEEGAADAGGAVTAPVESELPRSESGTRDACSPQQSQHLRDLGREYALSLVRHDFLGGKEIEHLVEDCTFDGEIYEGILHVRWRGMLLGWNQYNVWGRLRTYPDGSNATFAPRGASEGVQSLQFWGSLGTIGLSLVR